MKSEILFFEKQSFPTRRIAVALAAPPCFMLGLLIWQVVLGHPWGKQPMSNGNVIGWTIFVWAVYFRLLTVRLVTEVRDAELVVRFRGLWRAKHVPLREVKSAETITFDPLRDYGGYGIRTTRQGKAYIAKGTQGVRLKLADGSMLVIGSQKPNDLAKILGTPAPRVTRASS
jgi:hypothetical protein